MNQSERVTSSPAVLLEILHPDSAPCGGGDFWAEALFFAYRPFCSHAPAGHHRIQFRNRPAAQMGLFNKLQRHGGGEHRRDGLRIPRHVKEAIQNGGLLTAENKFVAESNLRQRIRQLREQEPADRQKTMARTMVLQDFPASAAYRKRLVPRPMMQLDDDIMEAMKKFERMEEVLCSLPGLDCGACGAPSCQGLAEDIVQGKAHEIDCIFKLRASVHKLSQGMLELAKQIPIYHEPKMLNNTEDEDYEG